MDGQQPRGSPGIPGSHILIILNRVEEMVREGGEGWQVGGWELF